MAGAMGMDPVAPVCGVSLAVIALCRELLDGQDGRRAGARAFGVLVALGAGAAMYLAGYHVMTARYGLAMEASLQPAAGGSLWGAWLYPLKLMLEPLTAYPHANIALRALLLLVGLAALVLCLRRVAFTRGLLLCVAALALPLLVQPPLHGLGIEDLEDGRLEAEMALAGQQGPAVGRDAVHIGIAAGEFREPLGRGLGQLPLRHLPELGHRDGGGQGLAAFAHLVQQADGFFPAGQGTRQLRPGPRQQARRPQPRLAAVGQEEADLPPAFFDDKGQMDGVALQEFHNAARTGILHT